MPTSLDSAREKLTSKRKQLADIFEKAGPEIDFTKPEVLSLTGKADSKSVVEYVNALGDECAALDKEAEAQAKAAKIAEQIQREHNAPVNAPPLPGTNGKKEMKRRTLGEIIVNAPVFKNYRATKTPMSEIVDVDGFGLANVKALFITSSGWAPYPEQTSIVVDAVTRPVQLLDLVPTGRCNSGSLEYFEETTRTHAAAERAEGAAYAESTFILTKQTETVRSIGDSVPVTDEQLDDVAQAQSYLDQRLMFGVRQRLDQQVYSGNGTAPNLSGITDRSIQTQAKGTDPTLDAIYKAMIKVRVTGRAFPNVVVIHPNDWQDIRLVRTADGQYIWGHPSEAGPERVFGVRVVAADIATEGTALVGDLNYCQLFERSGIQVEVGFINAQFTEGEKTIRAGLRAAFAVYRPNAFCSVTGI